MAVAEVVTSNDQERLFTNPWPTLAASLGVTLVAFLFSVLGEVLHGPWLPMSVLLMGAGLLAGATAIWIRPRSPIVVGVAFFVALLASQVADAAKIDSGGLLLRVLALIALLAALTLLLPRLGQRIVVSLFIVFHFGGILAAVTNVPPAPWLSIQLWSHVYRPYLQFFYLNNAYHFYSPDPGPATLLWFRVEYEKTAGQKHWRWVKVPELDEKTGQPLRPDGTSLRPFVEYTRRLSLAESINTPTPLPLNFQALESNRRWAAEIQRIPLHPEVPVTDQYREPNDMSKAWLSSYVRFVARNFKHQQHPELSVTGVKVYRVIHRMLQPGEFAQNIDPNDPTLFRPYYQGEFDEKGAIKESCLHIEYNADGTLKYRQQDPLLYWLIPRIREPKTSRPPSEDHTKVFNVPVGLEKQKAEPDEYVFKDYLAIQAGDEDEGGNEP